MLSPQQESEGPQKTLHYKGTEVMDWSFPNLGRGRRSSLCLRGLPRKEASQKGARLPPSSGKYLEEEFADIVSFLL